MINMKISLLHPVFTWFVIGLIGILLGTRSADEIPKRIVCVYKEREEWKEPYKHPFDYEPEDIPTELCTDVVYQGVHMHWLTLELEDPSPTNADRMRRLTSIGAAGNVNTLVRVFENFGSMSSEASDQSPRSKTLSFVSSVLRFIRDYGFDGLDIMWDGAYSTRENYVKLLEELVKAFKESRLLLTITFKLHHFMEESKRKVLAWDIRRMSELVDWIHVDPYICLGCRYGQPRSVDCESPLYPRQFDELDVDSYWSSRNVHDGLEMMVKRGAPRHKVMVGLSFSGISFTLQDTWNHYIFAKYNGTGDGGPVTDSRGEMAYFEICRGVKSGEWTRQFHHVGMCSYAYQGDQLVTYDDEQSIRIKMDYVRKRGFGGACVSPLQFDDFNGFCGGHKNHLLRTVHDVLSKKEEKTVDEGSEETMLRKRLEAMGIVPIACKGS